MNLSKISQNIWVRNFAISAIVGVLMAIAGAFDTYQVEIVTRLFYWISTIFIGSMIAAGTSVFLDKISFLDERHLIYHLFHLVIISVLITCMVVLVNSWLFDFALNIGALLGFFPTVLSVSIFMTFIHWIVSQIPMQSHGIKGVVATNAGVALYKRLPFKFQKAKILAIHAEDHYLRIYTDVGDTMILMRLYDAIKELEGIEGSQIHRSWWVAKDAIEEVVKGDGRINFRLSNGELAPVSRSFQNALKAQNWL